MIKTVKNRTFAKTVRPTDPDGCWLWSGAKSRGYGQVFVSGRRMYAHRLMYAWWFGPIPDGLHIDHLCRNRGCVNPNHLEPVTCRVNLLRGETFNATNARKTICPAGHPYSGANLYVAPRGDRMCKECKRSAAAASKRRVRERRRAAS